MAGSGEHLSGDALRRARLEQRIKKVRLAELMQVDPRTVGRWESADQVPAAVIPGLRQFLRLPEGDAASPSAEAARQELLRQATHEELLHELAARLHAIQPSTTELPEVPTGRYRLPKSRGPSRRARGADQQDKTGDQHQR